MTNSLSPRVNKTKKILVLALALTSVADASYARQPTENAPLLFSCLDQIRQLRLAKLMQHWGQMDLPELEATKQSAVRTPQSSTPLLG